MERIHPKLRKQYERWHAKLVGECDPYAGARSIGIEDVLRAHYLLCDYFQREGEEIALAGPRSDNLLVSAVSRQATGYGGEVKWKDDIEKCATLFFWLDQKPCFS